MDDDYLLNSDRSYWKMCFMYHVCMQMQMYEYVCVWWLESVWVWVCAYGIVLSCSWFVEQMK